MIWLSWAPSPREGHAGATHLLAGAAGLGVLLLGLAVHSRMIMRHLNGGRFAWALRRHNQVSRIARLLIPAWFGLMVYGTDCPLLVDDVLHWVGDLPLEAPAFLLGVSPALLAWVGLWWASYPAERALREQTLILRISANMPLRGGPTLWQYLVSNVRLQLLFMLLPVACILILRDVLALAADAMGIPLSEASHLVISLCALLPVMLFAPVMLVRILPTVPMPDTPLRRRLEDLCAASGFRVGRFLLWQTEGNIGNAAVMGMLPRWRYLLVTDLLLESMTDEQVLAVLAHEIGHVMHRHLFWMALCAMSIMFTISGPVDTVVRFVEQYVTISELWSSLAALAITAPLFLVLFGMFVRRLERQADVFAARTMPRIVGESDSAPVAPEAGQDFVRRDGAMIVCGALNRVAAINNVPTGAHEWLHGSIASRMRFLMRISDDAAATWRFDQFMHRLSLAVIFALCSMGGWTLWNMFR